VTIPLLLANAIIAFCYYGIAALVGAQLIQSRGRGLNPLGCATAGIFLTCALGHSVHVLGGLAALGALAPDSSAASSSPVLRWLCDVGAAAADQTLVGGVGLLTSAQIVVDALTVIPAVSFLALRRRYGLLVDGEAVILDYQRTLAGERARVAERSVALASAEARSQELAEARAQAEQAAVALRASETFLRAMIATAPVGIAIVAPDQTFQDINTALGEMLGFAPEELHGQSLLERIHPDDHAQAQGWVAALRRQPVPSPQVELRALHREGRPIWVTLTAALIRDEQGRLVAGLAIVQDMTGRRAMEERMRFQASALDAIGQAAIATDLAGSVIYGNHAAQSMYGRPATAGLHLADLVAPADIGHVARLRALYPAQLPLTRELTLRHHDGAPFPAYMSLAVVSGVDGAPAGMIGIITDLTERKQAEDARLELERNLQETQRLESLGVLAGGIAHDFNNLLTSVLGHAELAALDLPPDHKAARDLEQIVVGAQHAAELVRQLLAYSGQGQVAIVPVQLSALVQEMVDLIQVSVGKQAHLRTCFDPALPLVAADPAQLRQVVLNLLTNAAEAIGAGRGTITLETDVQEVDPAALAGVVIGAEQPAGCYVRLAVTDSGGGIAPQVQQRIFEPFFTTKFTGRGLGLAAVQGIIRAHQGVLALTSSPGEGATFQIWLPATDSQPAARPAPAAAPAPAGGALLIIDDEATVRAVLTILLERCGYQVWAAEDGLAGLALLEQGIDGLRGVFIDLTMPGMSGVLVAEQIYARQPALPLVLMSGYNTAALAVEVGQAGVAALLQKPYRIARLREVLRAIDVAWAAAGA
jgi:PAS domain S-box-containing protein